MENESIIYHDLIESIAAALDAKDSYTAEHSLRVGNMSLRVCRFLKIPELDAEIIHIAGHVHDIGKIGVPDYILNKNGKLTEEEWEIIKRHPQIGAKILKKSQSLKEISKIVLHHHERYDGKGYPCGLKGEEIPYGSRIIAICDSIDAMLSKRAYRESLSVLACKSEIEKNIGFMYDKEIAVCVLENWDKIVASNYYL
ncbi:MAG: HD domain-containing protein [Oscillospiraceae bacterium]|nr:HD domain-containing protein [Oscillospiraceae bacterium]